MPETVDVPQCPTGGPSDGRPGDDFNARGDVRALLKRHGWTLTKEGENEYWRRPGKARGWSATLRNRVFYVFSSNAAPLEPNQAYSAFSLCALLEHNGDYSGAAAALRREGFGGDPVVQADVDLSRLLTPLGAENGHADDDDRSSRAEQGPIDPGQIPDDLFHVPGFVASVMEFTLANAPYPNAGLAFCGALALQSYLCGRKVCTPGDLRPNLYLLALAGSGTGKDFPRKVNARVLFEIGQVGGLGDKFASGEHTIDTPMIATRGQTVAHGRPAKVAGGPEGQPPKGVRMAIGTSWRIRRQRGAGTGAGLETVSFL